MKRISFKFFTGMMVTLCSLSMSVAVNANDTDLDEFDLDITAEPITETMDMDDLLTPPPALDELPITDVPLAQKADDVAPVPTALEDAQDGIVPESNVLAMPAIDNEPVANALPAPIEVAPENLVIEPEPIETIVEPAPVATKQAKATPAQKMPSIVENPIVSQDRVVSATPIEAQPLVQGTVAPNGNCRQCNNGGRGVLPVMGRAKSMPVVPYVVYPNPNHRGVVYDAQRNGVHAYPHRNCPNCGRGHGRSVMQDPYYTLRGPRDFDDPNPRPIGP